jgi:hypothetical protein
MIEEQVKWNLILNNLKGEIWLSLEISGYTDVMSIM